MTSCFHVIGPESKTTLFRRVRQVAAPVGRQTIIITNNNTIYIAPMKSEDTEALSDAGLCLTKQMCL